MLNIQIIRGSTASKNVTFLGHGFPLKYCTTFGPRVAFIRVILTNDILFMFLMVWTSIYMVTLLHRHQKFRFGPRARKPRKSPQSRQPLKQSFTWWHFFKLILSSLCTFPFHITKILINSASVSFSHPQCSALWCWSIVTAGFSKCSVLFQREEGSFKSR